MVQLKLNKQYAIRTKFKGLDTTKETDSDLKYSTQNSFSELARNSTRYFCSTKLENRNLAINLATVS